MVYGVRLVWYLLGNAKDCGGAFSMLQGKFVRHCNGVIWMAAPHCLMWWIWQERNNRCFEDSEMIVADLKLFFFRTLSDSD